jgi:hypothetical protein
MTNVGMDIFARLLQMSLLLVANQSSTKLNCCFKVLGVTISLDSVHYFHWFVKKQVCIFSCFSLLSSLDSLGEIGLIPMKKPRAWNTLEPVGPLLPICDATIIKIHHLVSQKSEIAVWR